MCVVSVCVRDYNENSDARLENTQTTVILHVNVLNLLRQIPMTLTTQRCHDVSHMRMSHVAHVNESCHTCG